jgi:hypothetical protein
MMYVAAPMEVAIAPICLRSCCIGLCSGFPRQHYCGRTTLHLFISHYCYLNIYLLYYPYLPYFMAIPIWVMHFHSISTSTLILSPFLPHSLPALFYSATLLYFIVALYFIMFIFAFFITSNFIYFWLGLLLVFVQICFYTSYCFHIVSFFFSYSLHCCSHSNYNTMMNFQNLVSLFLSMSWLEYHCHCHFHFHYHFYHLYCWLDYQICFSLITIALLTTNYKYFTVVQHCCLYPKGYFYFHFHFIFHF